VEDEEEDKPWYEDAWDGVTSVVSEGGEQVAGVGKGFAEGSSASARAASCSTGYQA
jgi:hypothetical protein